MSDAKPRKDDPQMLAHLQDYIDAMGDVLGLPDDMVEDSMDPVLALTGVAARDVVRPAAPFAAMFAGWLVGAGRADSLLEALVMVREALDAYASADEEA